MTPARVGQLQACPNAARPKRAFAPRPTDGSCPNMTDSRGAVLHSRLNFVAKFALQLVSDAKNAVTRQKRRAQFHHPVRLSHHTQGSHEIFITAGCIDCHARPGRLRKNHCCSSCHRTGGGRSWPGRPGGRYGCDGCDRRHGQHGGRSRRYRCNRCHRRDGFFRL